MVRRSASRSVSRQLLHWIALLVACLDIAPSMVCLGQEAPQNAEAQVALRLDQATGEWDSIGTHAFDWERGKREPGLSGDDWRSWTLPPLLGETGLASSDSAADNGNLEADASLQSALVFEPDVPELFQASPKAARHRAWRWLPHSASARIGTHFDLKERSLRYGNGIGYVTADTTPYVGAGASLAVRGGGPVVLGDAYDWEWVLAGQNQNLVQLNLPNLDDLEVESDLTYGSLEANLVTSEDSSDGTKLMLGFPARFCSGIDGFPIIGLGKKRSTPLPTTSQNMVCPTSKSG
ncbi:MAG: hypothetical protein AAGD07_06705 [Planctomycetota bacterium]